MVMTLKEDMATQCTEDDHMELPQMLDTTLDTEDGIVISGIACRLPRSENMAKFRDNLLAGKDMTLEEHEDGTDEPEPRYREWAQLDDLGKFDADFFGISSKQAHLMDPQLRLLLEATYEAMIDAGIDPGTLRGSDTGVFVGLDISHAQEAWNTDPENPNSYAAWGCNKTMFANRISYTFDLQGPSYAIQSSSAGSGVALDEAYQSLRAGEIDAAVVAGSTLCLKHRRLYHHSLASYIGVHEHHKGGGDGIVVMILQRAHVAKRVYATILHCDAQLSPVQSALSYPTVSQQASFLARVYKEAEIDQELVEYVEATSVHNMHEMAALADVFSDTSLLVGSARSSTGQIDAASGLVSVAKALIAFEEGIIPPTLRYPDVTHDNLTVVSEHVPLDENLIAVNTLGYGGHHVHVILSHHEKSRLVHYVASQKQRLCVLASTTEDGVKKGLKFMQAHQEDLELHSLLNETVCQGNLPYRGYCLLNDANTTIHTQACASSTRPLWYVFSGMGTQWPAMGRTMMAVEGFSRSIRESSDILQPLGLNLHQMIMAGDEECYNTALNSFVGITAIQIALVEVLREMGLKPDGIIGHSVGEIACGYADGCLSSKEAILAAYWRGRCIQEAGLPEGGMAAVGLTWPEAQAQCPPGIVAACHNSKETVTISGPARDVETFVGELQGRGVFARKVHSAGVAFHSPYMQKVAPKLLEALAKHIKGNPRSRRWISTSVPEEEWHTDAAKTCSVQYLVNNLTSPVLFQEGLTKVPDDAIVIEIGPHELLQAILRRSLEKTVCHVGLMKRGHSDNVQHMFNSLGKCYINGLKINPLGIFPQVSYPVCRGTPMLSPTVSWDHSNTWDTPIYDDFLCPQSSRATSAKFEINVSPDGKDHYLQGHVINGRPMFPASGYILLAWKTLAKFHGLLHTQMDVAITSVTIHRATILPSTGSLKFEVNIIPELCDFEVLESEELVCSGKIQQKTQPLSVDHPEVDVCESPTRKVELQLTEAEVYKELRLRGYHYREKFRTVKQTDNRGERGELAWSGDWVTFLDGMMQMVLMSRPSPLLLLPTHLASLEISLKLHSTSTWPLTQDTQVITARVNSGNGVFAGGVKLQGLGVNYTRTVTTQNVLTQEAVFVPYDETVSPPELGYSLQQYGKDCASIAAKFVQTVSKTLSADSLKQSGLEAILKDLQANPSTETADATKYTKAKNCFLINLLNMLNTLPQGDSYKENMRSLLDAFEQDLESDALVSLLYTPQVLKSSLDTVLENLPLRHIELLEVAKDPKYLHKHVMECLKDKRVLRVDHTVTGNMPVEGTRHLDWDLLTQPQHDVGPFHVVMLDSVLSQIDDATAALTNISKVVTDDSFIIVKEPTDNFHISFVLDVLKGLLTSEKPENLKPRHWLGREAWLDTFKTFGFEPVSVKTDGNLHTVFVLRKESRKAAVDSQVIVDVSELSYKWVPEVKEKLAVCQGGPKGDNLWLVAERQPLSGVLGLVRCMALEPGGSKIRCLFLEDAGDVTMSTLKGSEIFKRLVQKDLVMNVYKDGKWGSYRHLPLHHDRTKVHPTTSARVELVGHPAQPVWVTAPPKSHPADNVDLVLCYPKFCLVDNTGVATLHGSKHNSLVHKDVNLTRDSPMGTVFSGYDHSGRKVMGVVPDQGISTEVFAPKHQVWEIPSDWSLERACSVPLAYCTAYYSLDMCANLQKHQSVLICGSNSSSHAAVILAQHTGSKVFVVMETEDAKQSLPKQIADKLKHKQMLLTNDGHFYSDVLQQTNGKGVDLVLDMEGRGCYENAVYALKSGGTFLQLVDRTEAVFSKYEDLFQRMCSYCPVSLEDLDPRQEERLSHLVQQGLKQGVMVPFDMIVYGRNDLTKVLGQNQKGTESVLINVSDESVTGPGSVPARKKLMFDPTHSYILVGGLGGFGLELAEWMIDRGATKLVLSSRSGVKTGYQSRKLRLWQDKGVTAVVSNRDVGTLEGARQLVEEAKKLGPVGGVFNLAMVLQDGYLSTLTEKNFQAVCAPKVTGTQHLDAVTRAHCGRTLAWFVTFSSVTSGFGNSGQSNYGFANAAMEQICKQRCKDGLPGMAIQWGAVGDVGVVMDRFGGGDVAIGGTLPQRLASCLGALEQFLLHPRAVVTSFVPETYTEQGQATGGQATQESLYKTVCNILGMKKSSSLKPELKLVDLGLDSLMATEVRQLLERNYKKLLTADQVRELTIGEIKELSRQHVSEMSFQDTTLLGDQSSGEASRKDKAQLWPTDEVIVKLNEIDNDKLPVYIVYDEENYTEVCDLVACLECPVYGLHATSQAPELSVYSLAGYFTQKLFAKYNNNITPLILIGHKFGCPVAMEMCLQLQDLGMVRHLVLVEGSHHFVPLGGREQLHHDTLEGLEGEEMENEALYAFVGKYIEVDDTLISCIDEFDEEEGSMKEKIDYMLAIMVSEVNEQIDLASHGQQFTPVSRAVLQRQLYAFVQRYIITCGYKPEGTYKGQVTLIRGRQLHKDVKVAGDYFLSKVCSGGVAVHILNHEHKDFLHVMKNDIVSILNATVQKVMDS